MAQEEYKGENYEVLSLLFEATMTVQKLVMTMEDTPKGIVLPEGYLQSVKDYRDKFVKLQEEAATRKITLDELFALGEEFEVIGLQFEAIKARTKGESH